MYIITELVSFIITKQLIYPSQHYLTQTEKFNKPYQKFHSESVTLAVISNEFLANLTVTNTWLQGNF